MMGRGHRLLYRLAGGRFLGRIAGMPVLLLTTTGRRSGRLRTTPLTYFEVGRDLVIVGSNGGEETPPRWWLNLQANPHARVTRGRDTREVQAREALGEEREQLWGMITATYAGYAAYAGRTTRTIPVVVLARTKENAPSR